MLAQAENQEMLNREPYIDVVIGPQSYHKINHILNNFQINKKEYFKTEFDTISNLIFLKKQKTSTAMFFIFNHSRRM